MGDITASKPNAPAPQSAPRMLKSESGMFRKKGYIEDISTLQIGEKENETI
jgi:hypothetical protein